MIRCQACKIIKLPTEFHRCRILTFVKKQKHIACRECTNKSNRKWHEGNKIARAKSIKKWRTSNKIKLREYENRYKQKHPEKILAKARHNRINTPIQTRARVQVLKALQKKLLIKGTCCISNHNCKGRIEAHHSNYSLPLEVTWLCANHHRAWHRAFKAILDFTKEQLSCFS